MQCNLIRIRKEYKNKKGESKVGNDFYLEFENGEVVAIQPKWTETKDGKPNSADFLRLRAFSTLKERK